MTLCTIHRCPVFGDTVDGAVRLNAIGNVVAATWRWLPSRFPHVSLDDWCVMPDHLHGVLVLSNGAMGGSRAVMGGSRAAPTDDATSTSVDIVTTRPKPLGGLIGAFKTVSTKHVNRMRNTPAAVIWQRNYWDHVIRDEADLHRIRAYIRAQGSTGSQSP